MPEFTYKAKAGPNDIRTGTIEAENEAIAVKVIRQSGLYPISVKESSIKPATKRQRRVSSKDTTSFTRQLANLVRSGFSLPRALSTIILQTQNPNFRILLEDLHEKIEKGFALSAALSLYPAQFSPFYINMINIGEAGGRLDEALERLADFRERREDLMSQVKSALAYPALLLIIGIITIFVLMSFVIPRLVVMFSDLGQTLPLPTQIIIQISTFMSKFWWIFLLLVGLVIILAKAFYKLEKNRIVLDGLILSFPGLRSLIQRIEISRFSYALGVLLESGVSMLEALKVVTLSVENRFFRSKVSVFSEKIRNGQSLSSCLEKDNLFPPLFTNMVGVGEESGELAQALLRIGENFEKEVNTTVKTIVSLIEPALILIMGLIIGSIVLSILLPIFQMNLLIS